MSGSSKIPAPKPDDQAQRERQAAYDQQRAAARPPSLPDAVTAQRYLHRAVEELGSAVADLGRVLIEGPSERNEALRGNVALGLERAAAYVRGQPFNKYPAGWDAEKDGKTETRSGS